MGVTNDALVLVLFFAPVMAYFAAIACGIFFIAPRPQLETNP
jgi:hypothetical protein